MRLCTATTGSGQPCQMAPLEGATLCFQHSPTTARERAEARKKGGRNRSRVSPAGDPGPVDLGSADAIRELLAEETRATLQRSPSDTRARTVVALLTLAVKLLEVGELEARLEALEEQLRTRRVA
jgi:hypothetical protein